MVRLTASWFVLDEHRSQALLGCIHPVFLQRGNGVMKRRCRLLNQQRRPFEPELLPLFNPFEGF
jgi:hypothetical protein